MIMSPLSLCVYAPSMSTSHTLREPCRPLLLRRPTSLPKQVSASREVQQYARPIYPTTKTANTHKFSTPESDNPAGKTVLISTRPSPRTREDTSVLSSRLGALRGLACLGPAEVINISAHGHFGSLTLTISQRAYPAFDQLSGPEVSGHLAKNRYVCFYSLLDGHWFPALNSGRTQGTHTQHSTDFALRRSSVSPNPWILNKLVWVNTTLRVDSYSAAGPPLSRGRYRGYWGIERFSQAGALVRWELSCSLVDSGTRSLVSSGTARSSVEPS